jgi:TetR/AcrR family transcriptional repressor of nem operon
MKKRPIKHRAKDNRSRIVDAAWELFWRQGYHATSINAVAKLANVPKGSVYNYFDSKESLVSYCLSRLQYKIETELRLEVLSGVLSPAELVNRLIDHYVETYSEVGFTRGDPLAGLLGELSGTHPELVQELRALQAAWRSVVAQKLWAYATVARIPVLVDAADNLAGIIYAALQGVLLQMKITRSRIPLDEARRVLVPMVNSYVSALATGEAEP